MWSKIDKSKLENGENYLLRMVSTVDIVDEKPYDIMVEMYCQWHEKYKVFASVGTGNLYEINDVDLIDMDFGI